MTVLQAIEKMLTTGKYKCGYCGELSKVNVESAEREVAVECRNCGALLVSCMKEGKG